MRATLVGAALLLLAPSMALAQASPDPEEAAPLPGAAGGLSIGLTSSGAQSESLRPELGLSAVVAFTPRLGGALDASVSPVPGAITGLVTPRVIVGGARALSHAYGSVLSQQTRYRDELVPGQETTAPQGGVYAYQVTEGKQALGRVNDLRFVGLTLGPRLLLGGAAAPDPVGVAAYVGVSGLLQRAPSWVVDPAAVGQGVVPESSWLGSAGLVVGSGGWYGEVEAAAVGGTARGPVDLRLVHGRIFTRMGPELFELGLGVGIGLQRNPAIRVEALPEAAPLP